MSNMAQWVIHHTADSGPIPQEGIDWIRARPEEVKKVMMQFPPACIMRLKEDYCHVKAGALLFCCSYAVSRDDEVLIRAVEAPNGHTLHLFTLNVLEYVKPRSRMTPELVKRIIETGAE